MESGDLIQVKEILPDHAPEIDWLLNLRGHYGIVLGKGKNIGPDACEILFSSGTHSLFNSWLEKK